jgi:DNA-binding winged helix-turn-helix (wHTH) protein
MPMRYNGQTMLVFPPYRLDPDAEQLWKGDALLALRRKPFAILRYLIAHPKKLVTHEELLAGVWRGAVVSDSAVRSHLHELRQTLGDGVIETVVGRGYRFIAELEGAAAPAPEVVKVDALVVARESELAALAAALERAKGGRRQMAFVTGDPGIGKSTLVNAFVGDLKVMVARGHCFETRGTAEPYLAIIEALSGLARSASHVLATLARYAPTFVAQVPNLVGDDQLDDVKRRAAGSSESRMARELCEALEAICSQDPLVLVLEDLQWSDVATIDLLAMLGQRQHRAKLFVIGTSRIAELADHPLQPVMRSLVARSGALSIAVPKIDVAAVQRFLDGRFVGHAFPAELAPVVAKITGGIPLFMVSLLDELVGRGMITDGKLTATIEDIQAHRPESVKQLIDIQLDRLPQNEQRVLEAAAIVGAVFSTDLVAAALNQPVDDVDDICDALARRSLFLRAEPDLQYGVTHALVQEVCLQRSSPARRQRWHRTIAETLAAREAASAQVAMHFDAAGDAAKAVPAYLAAGHKRGSYATADGIALCMRALELLPSLPANRDRDVLELQALNTIGVLKGMNMQSQAASRDAVELHRRAIAIARKLGEPASIYAAIAHLCIYHSVVAEYVEAAALWAELEQIAKDNALPEPLLRYGTLAGAFTTFLRGKLDVALPLFERISADPAAGTGPIHQSALHDDVAGTIIATVYFAGAVWASGDPDRALELVTTVVDVATRLDHHLLHLALLGRMRIRYLRHDPLDILDRELEELMRHLPEDRWMRDEARTLALWVEAQHATPAASSITQMLDAFQLRLGGASIQSTIVALPLIEVLQRANMTSEANQLLVQMIAFANDHEERVYLPNLLALQANQTPV